MVLLKLFRNNLDCFCVLVFQLSLALLFLVVEGTFTFTPTYTWTDEETEEAFTCQQCPRGTFVAKHCTSTSKTDCQPCPEHHYTAYWNYVEKCRFCNVICKDREQVKHECNATHNRVCECKPGFLWDSHYCKKDCRNKTDFGKLWIYCVFQGYLSSINQ